MPIQMPEPAFMGSLYKWTNTQFGTLGGPYNSEYHRACKAFREWAQQHAAGAVYGGYQSMGQIALNLLEKGILERDIRATIALLTD